MIEFITQYASQGSHRTATDVDAASAAWLSERLAAAVSAATGVRLRHFQTRRRMPLAGSVTVEANGGTWTARGVPLYDCGFYTGAGGITGVLGPGGSNCDIAVVAYSQAGVSDASDDLALARRNARHKAIIAVYSPPPEGVDGMALINADFFALGGAGPPALHVHSRHLAALRVAAIAGSRATVTASMTEDEAEAVNVEAEVAGRDASLAPVLVVTPRSGWWGCAVERGSSLAAFVEIARAVADARPRRTVLFSANTGHELGHTGYKHFSESHPDYERAAHVCVHLGANWASRHVGPDGLAATVQVSDPEAEALLIPALAAEGLGTSRIKLVRGDTRPMGEARELFDRGARYMSVLGRGLKEFHMEEDRETDVQLPLLLQLTRAVTRAVLQAAECEVVLRASM